MKTKTDGWKRCIYDGMSVDGGKAITPEQNNPVENSEVAKDEGEWGIWLNKISPLGESKVMQLDLSR